MPRFEPFPGVRYDPGRVPLDAVVAPPYDVIGPEEHRSLEARSPYNVVRVDLARAENGLDRYQTARCHFEEWLAEGVLVSDPEPAFYVYKMGFHGPDGTSRQTVGVIGALELSPPGDGDVLPHERTMGKVRDDRLELLRSCRANLSPIWGLSLAGGLSALCDVAGPPLARCTDDEGVHHRLWRVSQPGIAAAVSATVASAPVVIADGHHRYETALAYRDERRAADGAAAGDHDLVLAWVVELGDGQLSVGPIHRLLSGFPEQFNLPGALSVHFDLVDAGVPRADVADRLVAEGAFALVLPDRCWLVRPRAGLGVQAAPAGPGVQATQAGGAGDQPDAAVLDDELAGWPDHQTAYSHRPDDVVASVTSGRARAGFLLRPPTVGQIAGAAHERRRMPEKTSYFEPKPRTGLVFRRLRDR